MPVRPTAALSALLAAALCVTALTACDSGPGRGPDTIKVSYKQSTDNSVKVADTYLAAVKKQFERENPGKKVEFVPIKAPDAEYYTKLQQMLRSPRTAPDWSTRTPSSSTPTSPAGT
jgi:multiple sugar transport system substrate-binding protein